MESGILGFGIRSTAQGIRNPGGLESGIQVVPANNPESGAHKQHCEQLPTSVTAFLRTSYFILDTF